MASIVEYAGQPWAKQHLAMFKLAQNVRPIFFLAVMMFKRGPCIGVCIAHFKRFFTCLFVSSTLVQCMPANNFQEVQAGGHAARRAASRVISVWGFLAGVLWYGSTGADGAPGLPR